MGIPQTWLEIQTKLEAIDDFTIGKIARNAPDQRTICREESYSHQHERRQDDP